ncbi:hypothetical protein [Nonomuraea sp. GTA35]|uniref:hypothetical protein n=1 Tax=Nonomuraea sp. GTA35 TaxID=1676746 RepID=UPI0035BF9AB7
MTGNARFPGPAAGMMSVPGSGCGFPQVRKRARRSGRSQAAGEAIGSPPSTGRTTPVVQAVLVGQASARDALAEAAETATGTGGR